jgi:hypothetical protein
MLILLFVGKLTGLGFRGMKVFFLRNTLVITRKRGVKRYFYIFFAQCDYLIAIERKKNITLVNGFFSL